MTVRCSNPPFLAFFRLLELGWCVGSVRGWWKWVVAVNGGHGWWCEMVIERGGMEVWRNVVLGCVGGVWCQGVVA